MSCAGCSFLITIGAQVIIVADQAFVSTSSEVTFETRIAAHTFMATHYFSLRGRAYTHSCDTRTHTISRSLLEIFGDTVPCCFFFSFSAPTAVCVVLLFLLLFSCFLLVLPHGSVTEKVIIFCFAPFTCGSRSCSNNTFFSPSRVLPTRARSQRKFSPLFPIRDGAFALFLAAPQLSRQNRKTNQ